MASDSGRGAVAAWSRSASSRRKIFPDGDLGISVTNSTRRTFSCGATRSATYEISSRATAPVSAPGCLSTTTAVGMSPDSSSGRPITAASATAG